MMLFWRRVRDPANDFGFLADVSLSFATNQRSRIGLNRELPFHLKRPRKPEVDATQV
jgi:hypothetical protein